MPEVQIAEAYFIVAMMVLILVGSCAAVYIFFRQYRKEMREREERLAKKKTDAEAARKDRSVETHKA